MIIVDLKSPKKTGEITGGRLKGLEVYNFLFAQVDDNSYTPIPGLVNGYEIVRVSTNNKIIIIEYNSEDYWVKSRDLTGKVIHQHRMLERINYGNIKQVVKTGNYVSDFLQFFHLYHLTTDNEVLKKFYPENWKKYLHIVKLFNPHKYNFNDYILFHKWQ